MISSGAGSEMRQAVGTAVFFGMIGITFSGLLFTPVFYVAVRNLTDLKRERKLDDLNLSADPIE